MEEQIGTRTELTFHEHTNTDDLFKHERMAYEFLTYGLAFAGICIASAAVCFKEKAPYGRHRGEGEAPSFYKYAPELPVRISWVLMECPSSLFFALNFALSYLLSEENRVDDSISVPLALLILWEVHYVQRSFIWPICIFKPGTQTMNGFIVFFGFFLNCVNSYICSTSISRDKRYPLSYLYDMRFILGTLLFFLGYYINRKSDSILSDLRSQRTENDLDQSLIENQTNNTHLENDSSNSALVRRRYKIPHGFLFEYVSAPNYLGEIMIWLGWATASWSFQGLVFAFFTFCNLFPRALQNHQWYKDNFPDYPPDRTAIIPFLL